MNDQSHPHKDEMVTVNGVSFSHSDLFSVVDDFYTRIQNDPVLQVPFQSVHDWPEHQGLNQDDLSKELGGQSVVSKVLKGERELNVRQIKALAKRFKVSPEVFF